MFKITYEYQCDICNKTIPYAFSYTNDRVQIPVPKIPNGWYESPYGYICNEHEIIIDNKTKEDLDKEYFINDSGGEIR